MLYKKEFFVLKQIPPRFHCATRGLCALLGLALLVVLPTRLTAEPLRVGFYENPPKIFRDAEGQPTGFWPQVTEAILSNLGYEFEYIECEWEACLQMVRQGQLDLMPDVAFSEEREKQFQYINEALIYSWSTIVAAEGVEIKTLADFEGKRIAVLANSIQERDLSRFLREEGLKSKLIWTSSVQGAVDAVMVGDADLAITNTFFAVRMAEQEGLYIPELPFQVNSYHFIVPPDAPRNFVQALNLESYRQQMTFGSAFHSAEYEWISFHQAPLPPWLVTACLFAGAVLFVASALIFILRRVVRARTADLARTVEALSSEIDLRKKAEKFALETQKFDAIGRLVGGVAHDFNNLLSVIMGNLELLKEQKELDASSQKFADQALMATKRGAKLTYDLLSFGRRAQLVPQVLRIDLVLRGIEEMLRRTLPENIALEFSYSPHLKAVLLDQGQLENAVLNLVVNARDAMPEGGRLTITVADHGRETGGSASPDRVIVTVIDTGLGIKEDALTKVFEPFYTTKEVDKGSGMGLAMVHGFVTQSGGKISIRSVWGQGTTVELSFPVTQGVPEQIGDSKVSTGLLGDERILLVEDDEDVRTVLSQRLSASGFLVTQACDGAAALEKIKAPDDFDLVVTDLTMPGALQGVELVQRLREKTGARPTVVLTGYGPDALGSLAELPNCLLLSKPVSGPRLISKIRSLLDS
ncbi:ATP-binding protein [Phaeobacter sp. 11ANDIMAR09]|uniref:ATP-binding protein n=1 Tax=Phaeobacter sp. 11ANDIMAR09 TaxID=1225647 RepID=UPI0006C85B22|nr:transporter substrate-binding domain-containing protein [Phaeobacter sp. 11ANDIMAR09]